MSRERRASTLQSACKSATNNSAPNPENELKKSSPSNLRPKTKRGRCITVHYILTYTRRQRTKVILDRIFTKSIFVRTHAVFTLL